MSARRATTDRSDLGRALAALRPRITVTCEVCGAEYTLVARRQQGARTCSNRCRQQLYRDRKRAPNNTRRDTSAP